MKTVKITAALCLCLLLCACSAGERMGDITMVQGMGVDAVQDATAVSLQYLNLAKSSGAAQSAKGNVTAVSTGSGNSIGSAVSSLSDTLSREVFFGQNKVIVLGEAYAKTHLEKGMDYLLRSSDSRPDVAVAVTDKTAKEILQNKERGATVPAENIYRLLLLGEQEGRGAVVTVNALLDLYNDATADMYLPLISAKDDSVYCKGTAVFSEGKWALTLSENETFGFLLVQGKVNGGTMEIQSQTLGNIGLRIAVCRTKKRVSVQDGRPVFDINVEAEFLPEEMEKGILSSVSPKDYATMERALQNKMQRLGMRAVQRCFENKSDPFMTAHYLALSSPQTYRALKDTWKEQLPLMQIQVRATAHIQRINADTKHR